MIDPAAALDVLSRAGVGFYTGVPDSLLKEFNACLAAEVDPQLHVVAPNEGSAVACAAGHFLATGEPGLVYLQNSGLGNAVNPLASLASPQVYGIPMVLMIGWRGQPGTRDEPQHSHQGQITEQMLSLLEVPVFKVDAGTTGWAQSLEESVESSLTKMRPVALLVSAGSFGKYEPPSQPDSSTGLPLRSEVLTTILETLPSETFFVATTGYTARELAALRSARGEKSDRDFLVVGSMGHAGSIALSMALARPEATVVCLDGDGSMAMHLGAMAMIGLRRPPNLGHVLINNGVHESVGGQPTVLQGADLSAIARACGYPSTESCDRLSDLAPKLATLANAAGPWFLEVKVRQGTLPELPRPGDFASRLERLRSTFGS